jgi:uncharacterized protein YdiU (UPF0061 family)
MTSRETAQGAPAPDFPFDNTYARLPDRFYARLAPAPVPAPRLIALNQALARELDLDPDALKSAAGAAILAGNRVPTGAEPLAMAYAGHQFGHFVPQLGDGRAILLGEVVDRAGRRRDIQLKGSGRTPFSRSGDGRAALGPVLREYIVSESFAALGIPTTRSLAAVTTGDMVARETFLPGAVLTRVAESHVRVGTFQFFASRGDIAGVQQLLDYVVARHYPELADRPDKARAFVDAVIARQARLIARWMGVGFIHGVMNTDNTSIAGETIDYGPCAFMDTYHPMTVFSSIDVHGRYAFANQPAIANWNLARLAETLMPLMSEDRDEAVRLAQGAIDAFPGLFRSALTEVLRAKLGLAMPREDDLDLAETLFDAMANGKADFTLLFRRLCDAAADESADASVRALFAEPQLFDDWAARWRERLAEETRAPDERRVAMRRVNPAFIARNHRVEQAIRAAVDRDDLAPFHRLNAVLARPFDDQPENADYMSPPLPDEIVQQTFCGT